jgi:hypothetical protein
MGERHDLNAGIKAWTGGAVSTGAVALASAGTPWPAVALLLILSVLFGCLCIWLQYRGQVRKRHFEHVERMRALDKACRSQVADVVAKFGGS